MPKTNVPPHGTSRLITVHKLKPKMALLADIRRGASGRELDSHSSDPQPVEPSKCNRASGRTTCTWPGHDLFTAWYGYCRVCHVVKDSVLRCGTQTERERRLHTVPKRVPSVLEARDPTAAASRTSSDINETPPRKRKDGGASLFLPQGQMASSKSQSALVPSVAKASLSVSKATKRSPRPQQDGLCYRKSCAGKLCNCKGKSPLITNLFNKQPSALSLHLKHKELKSRPQEVSLRIGLPAD